ncbi:carbon storage regulator CsrA [Pseudomonas sp. V1]|uniref:carbon storage regulator CsrA n=1 Tax=Pseudomonas arcuscaelestis TaxID=2710591 RepID=UPI00193F3535|nr:carbon storage regulator CsrA [Pseudomonas arcuscaelestis]MBM3105648.1 carbon storage regulator CsrA [Pseudomonas arcuscaelestis]
MLILTRMVGETIKIGNEISVTVIANNQGQIRLGIDALKEVPVHRKEVYLRIMEENEDR